jgi:hypothetical protein
MELAVGGYAGFHTTTPPTDASDFGVYWPALVPTEIITQRLMLPDGTVRVIEHSVPGAATEEVRPGETTQPVDAGPALDDRDTVRAPLGLVCGARSGDKGGNANVGLWARSPAEYEWLRSYLTVDRFRQLLAEAETVPVRRFELPNLLALNFVVVGLLGNGVADSARPDPQAKGLGEYVRSRYVDLPTAWLTVPAAQGQRS